MSIEKEIDIAIGFLKKGKTILYPTDTIWGIGCDATNQKAVQNIYKIKGRNESKTMIVLIDDFENLHKYIKEIPPTTKDIINNCTQPLTIVYDGAKNIAKNLIASDGTIAIRIAKDEFCSSLIRKFGKPIVSTSANISGFTAPRYFPEIEDTIKDKVDYVVNHNLEKIEGLKASRIIKIEKNGNFEILRP